MDTKVMRADCEGVRAAAALIRRGELVAFPTETVYGLGADALNSSAVRKIFDAKGRPGDNPLIVHVLSAADALPLIDGDAPDALHRLAAAYWPGPLTMVVNKASCVPDEVTAGQPTVGIRVPSHPAARALIEAAGLPIAAPSANRSGRPSPTTAAHVHLDMDGRIPLILDGGACEVGLESTVLDITTDLPRVLRPGGVTVEMIARVCGAVRLDDSLMRPLMDGETARSPGMKYQHYAPDARMTVVRGGAAAAPVIARLYDEAEAAGEVACILALTDHVPAYGARRVRDLGADARAAGINLFSALRDMDAQGVTRVFSEAVDAVGVGLAVMNRMGRAAAFDIIDAEEQSST